METTGIIGFYRDCTGIVGYILGLYRDNGKGNGNYRDYRGYIRVL